MKYSINLIENIRRDERRNRVRKNRLLFYTALSFLLFFVAVAFSYRNVEEMKSVVDKERAKLESLQAQFQKYQSTTMIVNRTDIENLNRLQGDRIFWTKKLSSIALHLPENYWITHFSYQGNIFEVQGFGYITKEQQQLMVLDTFVNQLRGDTLFNDVFTEISLASVMRSDEGELERVHFSVTSRGGNK